MTKTVRLSALRCLQYEVAFNGLKILKETINDLSLWRLIEYPWCSTALDLHKGDLVLDIGTGTATFPQMLAREGVHTVVLELDADRVRWQREKTERVTRPGDGRVYAVVADATALPIKSGAGKRVSAISSLEHIPDDVAVGQEIGRVLADQGVAVITLPYTRTERTGFFQGIRTFKKVAPNAFVQEGKAGSFFRFYNDQALEDVYIEPSGGEVVQWGAYGRRVLNGMYHETKLTKYWRTFVLKDLLLAWLVHPLEERFGRATEPLYVMFKIVKRREADHG
ncbi:MAG: class I SAM-dependent methyltransferase [Roseiflexaceae bacterium]|nr:class I SAM-dependent methyltransferase [Roseiflexaceae bacterium]